MGGFLARYCAEEDAEEGFEAYEGLVCRGSSIMEENEFDRVRRELLIRGGNCVKHWVERVCTKELERTRRDFVNSVFSVGS